MDKTDEKYVAYVQILEKELIPAMGCTEPIAVAYAAAKAREVLGVDAGEVDHVEVYVSNNIIKNVKSVIVPNTDGLKGIEAAVAAGIVGGCAERQLEVISDINGEQKTQILAFRNHVPITARALENGLVFDIVIVLHAGNTFSKVRICQNHTNVAYVEKNGQVLFSKEVKENDEDAYSGLKDLLNIKDILDFANVCDLKDVREVLERQIRYNSAIAERGLSENFGGNVGSTIKKAFGDGIGIRAMAMAAAGSDARMSGCELPVVINSGSGNQGITVSVPVIEYAKELHSSEDKLYRALVISNLIAVHEKSGIGCLSAYCGAVSAGCAAACGIAYLQGGGYEEIAHTLVNSVVSASGIICDGAKPACAAKIALSVQAGLLGYHMFRNGRQEFKYGDGIVNRDVESTIRNVGRLAKEGMKDTDREIVRIMIEE